MAIEKDDMAFHRLITHLRYAVSGMDHYVIHMMEVECWP